MQERIATDTTTDPSSLYFMDSASEVWRLERKTDPVAVGQHLLASGLRSGMSCVDVACGSGAVTRIMSKLSGNDQIFGIDQSADRLKVARDLAHKDRTPIQFLEGQSVALPLPDAASDYTHARMLFQYLSPRRRLQTLREMMRVTRPGGLVVVVDLDQQLTRLYPMPLEVHEDLRAALQLLRRKTGFDANVGRKLLRDMDAAGLTNISVIVEPYQRYVGGALPPRDRENWEEKMRTASEFLTRETGETLRWSRFRTAYLKALQAPNAFYCADAVIAIGECPH